MVESDFTDPYIDPSTGILRNLVGARNQAELDAAEFDLVHAAEMVLLESPPTHSVSVDEWRAIHKSLFRDVYEWAGELRTVNIAKSSGGIGFEFVGIPFFDKAIPFVEAEIQNAFAGTRLGREDFIARLAEQYSNLNVLHPFREGNGRTQRFFWSQLARTFDYDLDWLSITAEQNAVASGVAATALDYGPLLNLFRQVVNDETQSESPIAGITFAHAEPRQAARSSVRNAPVICSFPMPRAKKPCVLTLGHGGHHRSRLRAR